MAYPVTFDIQAPDRFDKVHVAIRVLIVIVLALLVGSVGWIWGAAYLIFPIAAAILISQRGADRFLEDSDSNVTLWLRYVAAFYAYIGMLTDRFINEDPIETLQLSVHPDGEPTPGSALLRIIIGIPHAIVLAILAIAFIVVLPLAAIWILVDERYPSWAYDFSRGWLRWATRLLAYMASLTDEYPPFTFEGGSAELEEPGTGTV